MKCEKVENFSFNKTVFQQILYCRKYSVKCGFTQWWLLKSDAKLSREKPRGLTQGSICL